MVNRKLKLEDKTEEADKSEGVSKEVESMLCGLCTETEGEDVKVEDDEEITPDDFAGMIDDINTLIKGAEEHVKMHTDKREEANMCIAEGKADYEAKNPLYESTVALTMDMSKNGTVPTLREDKSGDFYYMSPKNEYIFGVCNNATTFMNV